MAAGVFGFAALYHALQACRRGKRSTRKAQRYELRLLDNLWETSTALQQHAWRPARAIRFVTLQPKPREILAAEFGDRVVHHLLVGWLERFYEPVFIHDSFANRRGKGTLAAVQRLQAFTRAPGTGYYLQLDVGNFFNSINRRILFGLIRARLHRDQRRASGAARYCPPAQAQHMLWLVRLLLTGNPAVRARFQGCTQHLLRVPAHKQLLHAMPETGLPIGNLTSQFFANVYLNELDQFVKHQLGARHYVRYVDDFVLLHECPQQLVQWRTQIATFLHNRLQLSLRDAGILAPVSQGIDFLGYVLRPHYMLVRRRVVANLHDKLHAMHAQLRHKDNSLRCSPAQADALFAMLASYWGHFSHAKSQPLRTGLLGRHTWLQHWVAEASAQCQLRRVDRASYDQTLPEQWRWFARRYPGYVLMVQVGRDWECSWGLPTMKVQRQPGLPPTYRLRKQQLLRLQQACIREGQPWLQVVENGYQTTGRKRRQLCALWSGLAGGF
ncbi:MAG: RNA-directed DNA polymerase [Gammaproteobacteria bacterium]|nr:RNA-directed DNA polymerase [Gammaproteobacteria bacterium]